MLQDSTEWLYQIRLDSKLFDMTKEPMESINKNIVESIH